MVESVKENHLKQRTVVEAQAFIRTHWMQLGANLKRSLRDSDARLSREVRINGL